MSVHLRFPVKLQLSSAVMVMLSKQTDFSQLFLPSWY